MNEKTQENLKLEIETLKKEFPALAGLEKKFPALSRDLQEVEWDSLTYIDYLRIAKDLKTSILENNTLYFIYRGTKRMGAKHGDYLYSILQIQGGQIVDITEKVVVLRERKYLRAYKFEDTLLQFRSGELSMVGYIIEDLESLLEVTDLNFKINGLFEKII